MRLLPDKHIKNTYMEHYKINYERLANRKSRKQHTISLGVIKLQIVGCVVFIIITLAVLVVGFFVLLNRSEKINQISELNSEIQQYEDLIKQYQIIDSEEKNEQINEAVHYVVDLQDQYLSNTFSDTFETYAARYLGSYNENWASDYNDLVAPGWQGFINKACDLMDSAEMVFILYDVSVPKMVVAVSYDLDKFGNLGEMTSMNKVMLV